MFYYVYILESEADGKSYTGYTSDLKLRLEQHNKGQVESTKARRPLKLIYFEGCINQQNATKREKYLKIHYGKMFIKNRLKSYLTGQGCKSTEERDKRYKHKDNRLFRRVPVQPAIA